MKSSLVSATTLAAGLALAGLAHAAPPAKSFKVSLTEPTAATAATIKITKASKAQIKVGAGAVTFALKVNGVVNKVDDTPNTSTGNTFTVQFVVGGVTRNADFIFDLANGKTSPATTLKFPVGLNDSGTWGSVLAADAPIEIRRMRLIENTTGEDFGVMGITTR